MAGEMAKGVQRDERSTGSKASGVNKQSAVGFHADGLRGDLRENVPPPMRDAYDRIVLAGMKVMFSEETHNEVMRTAMSAPGETDDKIAAGISDLMVMLYKQSNDTMPQELLIPAAIDLTLQAVEFIGKADMGEVDQNTMASAIQKMTISVFSKFGVDEEQMMAGPQSVSPAQQIMNPEAGPGTQAGSGGQGPAQPPAGGGMIRSV